MDLQTKLECSSREKKKTLAREEVFSRNKIRSKIPENQTIVKETIPAELLKQCGMTKVFTAFNNINIQTEFTLQKITRLDIWATNKALLFYFCKESHVKVLEVSGDKKQILLNIKINNLSDPDQPLYNSLLLIQVEGNLQFLFIHNRRTMPESVTTIDAFHKHSLPRIVYENITEFTRVKLDDWKDYLRRPLKKGDPQCEHYGTINGQCVVYKIVDNVWFENYPDKRVVTTCFQTAIGP